MILVILVWLILSLKWNPAFVLALSFNLTVNSDLSEYWRNSSLAICKAFTCLPAGIYFFRSWTFLVFFNAFFHCLSIRCQLAVCESKLWHAYTHDSSQIPTRFDIESCFLNMKHICSDVIADVQICSHGVFLPVYDDAVSYAISFDLFSFVPSLPCLFSQVERCYYFLHSCVETAQRNEPVDGRLVQFLLSNPTNDGGQWDMLVNLIGQFAPQISNLKSSCDFSVLAGKTCFATNYIPFRKCV